MVSILSSFKNWPQVYDLDWPIRAFILGPQWLAQSGSCDPHWASKALTGLSASLGLSDQKNVSLELLGCCLSPLGESLSISEATVKKVWKIYEGCQRERMRGPNLWRSLSNYTWNKISPRLLILWGNIFLFLFISIRAENLSFKLSAFVS